MDVQLGQRAVAKGKVLWEKKGYNRTVYREDIEPVEVVVVGTSVRKSGLVVPSKFVDGADGGEGKDGYLDNVLCHPVIMCQRVAGNRYIQPFAVFLEDLDLAGPA